MKECLVLRLLNAANECDKRGNHNLAALITEAIEEIENGQGKPNPGNNGAVQNKRIAEPA